MKLVMIAGAMTSTLIFFQNKRRRIKREATNAHKQKKTPRICHWSPSSHRCVLYAVHPPIGCPEFVCSPRASFRDICLFLFVCAAKRFFAFSIGFQLNAFKFGWVASNLEEKRCPIGEVGYHPRMTRPRHRSSQSISGVYAQKWVRWI